MSGCPTAEGIKQFVDSTITGCEDKCNAEKNCTHIWYISNGITIDCYLYSSCNNQPDYNQIGGSLIQKPGKGSLKISFISIS